MIECRAANLYMQRAPSADQRIGWRSQIRRFVRIENTYAYIATF